MVTGCYTGYTTTGNSTTSAVIWQGLVFGFAGGGTDATSTLSTDVTWASWTYTYVQPVAGVVETPEVRQARDVEIVRLQAEAVKRNEENEAAKKRAERLLVEHLTLAQRAAYEKDRFFEVVAAKARYRIYHDGAVRRLGEDGREVAVYCIHPDEAIPAGDLALAKKLLLEADEAAFRRIANESLIGIAVNVA